MDRSPVRDFVVGLFVLAGLGTLAYLSVSLGGFEWRSRGQLKLNALFDETGKLSPRAPVVISGVRVGEVTGVSLNHDFRAKVEMELESSLQLPADTTASIVTSGILGDRYIMLQPGGDERILKSGDYIAMTESAIILERLIGKLVYGAKGGEKSAENPTSAPATKP